MNETTNSYVFESINSMLYKVFGWMMVALLISAGTAYYIASHPAFFETIFKSPFLLFFIFLAQLLLVIILSALIMKINFPTAITCFISYALLTGLTLSVIFMVYTQQSIFITFIVAAGMFGTMALYGYFTKADLSAVGSYATMALFGIIIGFVVNFFLKSGTFDYILSLIGIVVFVLLTAYDMQKIKNMISTMNYKNDIKNKIALVGALMLYLDFINLFLMLLRVFGRRNSD